MFDVNVASCIAIDHRLANALLAFKLIQISTTALPVASEAQAGIVNAEMVSNWNAGSTPEFKPFNQTSVVLRSSGGNIVISTYKDGLDWVFSNSKGLRWMYIFQKTDAVAITNGVISSSSILSYYTYEGMLMLTADVTDGNITSGEILGLFMIQHINYTGLVVSGFVSSKLN